MPAKTLQITETFLLSTIQKENTKIHPNKELISFINELLTYPSLDADSKDIEIFKLKRNLQAAQSTAKQLVDHIEYLNERTNSIG
jgi:hypothetical protein